MVTDSELIDEFKKSFFYDGELVLHDEKVVSVVKDSTSPGHVRVKPHVTRLDWKFRQVDGNFSADRALLETLDGAPRYIGGNLMLTGATYLRAFGEGLEHVGGNMQITDAPITSFQGGPKTIGSYFRGVHLSALKTLEGFPEQVTTVQITYHKHLPLLRTLVASSIWLDTYLDTTVTDDQVQRVENILNEYAGQGKAGAWECKRELQQAGFRENARW